MNVRIQKKLIREGLLPEHFEVSSGLPTGTGNGRINGESGGNGEKSFWSWFWEDVIGLSSESYRREFWRAAKRGYTIGPVPETLASWQRRRGVPIRARVGDALLVLLVVGGPALAFHLVRRLVRRHISQLRRPTYYDRERERRIELGRQRRAITARRTYNAKPTFEAIRAAWNGARHNPEGALRLGGLLEDLECYVNNHARGDAVTGYRGRYGGIKRLLEAEAPDLFAHYAALMRYKSIARRFRQACGLEDPVPVDAVLPLKDVARSPHTGSMGGKTQAIESMPHDGSVGGKICSEEIKRMGMPDTGSACEAAKTEGPEMTRETAQETGFEAEGMDGEGLVEAGFARDGLGGDGLGGDGLGGDGLGGDELGGDELGGDELGGDDLERGNLEKSNLERGNLERGNLERGNLGESNFGEGNLDKGNLGEGNLGEGNLDKGNLEREKPKQERLEGTVIEDVLFPKRAYVLTEAAYATAVRVLRRCEQSVISLEAALALEIAPELAGVKSEGVMVSSKTPGMIAERVIVWIRRKTRAA